MIPSSSQAALAMFGAWRLARLDARGTECFENSVEGVWRSFFAAVLVYPAYALMLVLRYTHLPEGTDAARFAFAETIAYVISWVAYPLIMLNVARALDRGERALVYISAYNWSLVLQNALVLPLSALSLAGLLPAGLDQLLWLAAIGAILVYVWFVARAGLKLSRLAATGVVAIDVTLSLVISAVADGLY
jgi:hypothetical protein